MELLAVDAALKPGTWCGGAATSPGRRRSCNEDALLCGPVWFAVADGMGGHDSGGVASAIVVDLLRRHPPVGGLAELAGVIGVLNGAIRSAARRDGTVGMGTTLVAATATGEGVAIVHIGDSRCYRLADGALQLLTRDHSHVQELVDLGRIDADEVGGHPHRHVVTRALGLDPVAEADIVVVPAPTGRLLLCSDGLTAELSPTTIGRVMAGIADPQTAAGRLVELARRGVARDDITAVVVDGIEARG